MWNGSRRATTSFVLRWTNWIQIRSENDFVADRQERFNEVIVFVHETLSRQCLFVADQTSLVMRCESRSTNKQFYDFVNMVLDGTNKVCILKVKLEIACAVFLQSYMECDEGAPRWRSDERRIKISSLTSEWWPTANHALAITLTKKLKNWDFQFIRMWWDLSLIREVLEVLKISNVSQYKRT